MPKTPFQEAFEAWPYLIDTDDAWFWAGLWLHGDKGPGRSLLYYVSGGVGDPIEVKISKTKTAVSVPKELEAFISHCVKADIPPIIIIPYDEAELIDQMKKVDKNSLVEA